MVPLRRFGYSSPVCRSSISTAMLAIAVIFLGCRRSGDSTARRSPQPREDARPPLSSTNDGKDVYAVYDALLGGPSSDDSPASGEPIAIEDRTHVESLCSLGPAVTLLDRGLRSAAEDFAAQDSRPWPLQVDELRLGRKVESMSSKEIDDIFSAEGPSGWERFRKEYPDVHGYVELSAVGFNADRSFALVYSAVHCGPLCGAGGFVTLAKKKGVWRKNKDRLCSWIS